MSTLEEEVRQEVTALISGAPLATTSQRLARLARWVTLKLMVLDASTRGENVFHSEEMASFFMSRTLPATLSVEVYQCGVGPWQSAYFATATLASHGSNPSMERTRKNLKTFVFGLGQALIHAIYARDVGVAAAKNEGLSHTLVPSTGPEWLWPPERRLTAQQAEILALELRQMRSPGINWKPLPSEWMRSRRA